MKISNNKREINSYFWRLFGFVLSGAELLNLTILFCHSLQDQEKLFSPSMWNKRFSPTDVITNFMKLAEQALLRARKNTSCQIDIPYGPSERTKYDVYGTDLPHDAPILVFVHGGYWQELSKEMYTFPVESCVSEGIKVICVGYDLCPDGDILIYQLWYMSQSASTQTPSYLNDPDLPAFEICFSGRRKKRFDMRDIVCQIKAAVRKILHDAAKAGSRGVWISGHSAGAHLSASLLDFEWLENEPNISLLKGLVLLGGIYYLEQVLNTSYNKLLKLDSQEAKLMSTLNVKLPVPNKDLKVLVIVAECDSPELVNQGRRLTKELCSSVAHVEYIHLRDSIDHFDMIEKLADKDFSLTKRIIKLINGYSAENKTANYINGSTTNGCTMDMGPKSL